MSKWFGLLAVAMVLAAEPAFAGAMEGLPLPEGAKLLESKDLGHGGTKQAFETSASAAEVVASYAKILGATGWTITREGSGSGPTGGGAELGANHDDRHLVLQAGGPKGKTFVGLCVWPKRPPNDYCG